MFEIEKESISRKSICNLISIDFNILQINIPIAKQLKKINNHNKYHKNIKYLIKEQENNKHNSMSMTYYKPSKIT